MARIKRWVLYDHDQRQLLTTQTFPTKTRAKNFAENRGLDIGAVLPINITVASADDDEPFHLTPCAQEIVERLRQGPAMHTELAQIGVRYSARIEEMRKAGYVFGISYNPGQCMNRYTLISEPDDIG